VGLATARALALASGARMLGASSLAALALSTRARRALICPMVPAGRRDAYVGFFRADTRGTVCLAAGPIVAALEPALAAIEEARRATGVTGVRCVGPAVERWREALEHAFPACAEEPWRFGGLSALDLAAATRSGRGPAAGLPAERDPLQPLYVRSAQAEERVRHQAAACEPTTLRPLTAADVPAVAAIERQVFPDPWPESFFHGELEHPMVYARIAERGGRLAGYSIAWVGAGGGHLGNLAVVPEARRRGVAHALMSDLRERARLVRAESLTLEVRASNFAAQALYRAHGFRLAGLRRGYYRDTGEDALVMEWRNDAE
jgi:ribosomal-protein-alanine N-acetyltransferase